MNPGSYYKYLITGALIIFLFNSAQGQEQISSIPEQDNDQYTIHWVSEYPVIKTKKEK